MIMHEAADALARNAHYVQDVPEASFRDPFDRGLAWVQAVGSDELYSALYITQQQTISNNKNNAEATQVMPQKQINHQQSF